MARLVRAGFFERTIMAAGVYNIAIEQGATFSLVATLTSDGTTPVDLTGYTGRGKIKTAAYDSTAVATFAITIPSPATGAVNIVLTPTQTAAIEATGAGYSDVTNYYYDVELYTAADADVIRLLNGSVTVSPEITKGA
jgi:hypothetical protein